MGVRSYKDLWKEVKTIGNVLISMGLNPGKRVVVNLSNSIEFVSCFYGVFFAGGVVCPFDELLGAKNCYSQMLNIDPYIIILSKRNYKRYLEVDQLAKLLSGYICIILDDKTININRNINPNSFLINSFSELSPASETDEPIFTNYRDIAQLIHTTGTTNYQKAVMLNHIQMCLGTNKIISITNLTNKDIEVITLPLVRLFGQFHLHAYLQVGATMVIEPNLQNYKRVLNDIVFYKATSFPQVISGFNLLMKEEPELLKKCDDYLRYVMLCSMKTTLKQLELLQKHLPTTHIINTYGLTEAIRSTAINTTLHPDKIESVGRPVVGVKIEIFDENKQAVNKYTIGEIVISSKHIFSGYWNNEELTKKCIYNGKFLTGDLGYLDEDNYLYYVCRKTEEINVAGKKFYPQEIEEIILEYCPKVEEAIIVPIPDPEGIFGMLPFLFVKERNGQKVDFVEIKSYLISMVETYKIPRYHLIITDIPKTETGKIIRQKLSEIAINYLKNEYGN